MVARVASVDVEAAARPLACRRRVERCLYLLSGGQPRWLGTVMAIVEPGGRL